MTEPIHPRLLKRARATRRFLVATVAVGILTAGLLIVQARVLADWITRAFEAQALPSGWQSALLALAVVFAARGLLAWLSSTLAHRSAAAVKSQLRRLSPPDPLQAHREGSGRRQAGRRPHRAAACGPRLCG